MSRHNDHLGVLHRHEDGREHRHFSAGFEIGGQVIEDQDGTEEHSHGTFADPTLSGPVVWHETNGQTVTLTYDPKVADPNPIDGSNVHVGQVVGRYSDGSFDFDPVSGEPTWTVTALDLERDTVTVDPKQVS